MTNETLDTIMQMPLFWRAAIALFVIWFVYMLFSRLIFKLIALVSTFINWLWSLLYFAVNNLMHIIHRAGGKSMIGLDQSVTDFFGGIYGFFSRFKMAIDNSCRAKEKPFVGTAFFIAVVLVFWIAAPTWLNSEENTNAFTAAYHKYIEAESRILDLMFGGE
ncbi:MAG: hypothetical protein FWH14_00510 [Oscillospiraceae bacterium]|nr:hypothetical protein [Oscillospiraceae bacterium]